MWAILRTAMTEPSGTKMLLWILKTWFHSHDDNKSDFVFVQEISIMERQFMLSKVGIYTGCPSRNVPNFGRVFLMLKYTDITQNTYIQI
jgi:hypothetical protein